MPDNNKRIVLITGAASGIGRQLAVQYAKSDCVVIGVDNNAPGLEQLGNELGVESFRPAIADVTDSAELITKIGSLRGELGAIDLMVAAAGVGLETSALRYDAESMQRVISVNLIGVSNSIASVLPDMLDRNAGHIVALSSLSSYRGLPRMLGYCASKAGVNALMEGLRVEIRGTNVASTIICPGWVRTPMTENIKLPPSEFMEVAEAAREIIEAVRKRKRFHAFPGKMARQMAMVRRLPAPISDWLIHRMLSKMK